VLWVVIDADQDERRMQDGVSRLDGIEPTIAIRHDSSPAVRAVIISVVRSSGWI
jgi:hypothetical protein